MSHRHRPSARHPFILFLEDHGARLTDPDGQELGLILEAPEGAQRRTQWADELRRLLPKGASVQTCVGLSRLSFQCQETPAMPPGEAREVALRLVSAEPGGEAMLVGQALDADGEARGGHVHWTAYLPASDLNGWASALATTGMDWIHASALPRVLARALPQMPGTPRDRIVLALEPVPKPPCGALRAPGGVPQGRRDEHSGSTRFESDVAGCPPPPQPGGTKPGGRSSASAPLNDEQHRPAGPSLRSIPPGFVAAHGGFGTGSQAPQLGRLLFFRGSALILQRTFRLSTEVPEAENLELSVEETARTLQFYKQKFRGSVPADLLVVGAESLPEALLSRLRGMGLATHCAPESLDEVLLRGLALERASHGLDLRPGHVQEAQRRRTLRAVLVLVSVALLAAFIVGGGLLHTRERMLEAQAIEADAELAQRLAADQGRKRVVAARGPLLRLRAAEQRQVQATERISRLAAALFSPPPGLELEKLEIQQLPGDEGVLAFQITGTAFTQLSFSVGPLTAYVTELQRLPGLALDPLKDISVSDRVAAGDTAPQARALTRFTLSGRLQ